MGGIDRASSDGITGLEDEANGSPVQEASDEFGRSWVRLFADGAAVDQGNPLPVTVVGAATVDLYSSTTGAVPEVTRLVKAAAGTLLEVEITAALTENADVWCLVFDEAVTPPIGATPISRFFVGKQGATKVRAWDERTMSAGISLVLSLDPKDIVTPATVGGFFNVTYR